MKNNFKHLITIYLLVISCQNASTFSRSDSKLNTWPTRNVSCQLNPQIRVDEKVFTFYSRVRDLVRSPKFVQTTPQVRKQELSKVIKDNVRALGGIPRAQMVGILQSVIEREQNRGKGLLACSEDWQKLSQNGVDLLIDELLKSVTSSESNSQTNKFLAASFMDCPITTDQKAIMPTAIPDSDSGPWTDISYKKSQVFDASFPSIDGESIEFSNGLKAVVKWNKTHTEQLTSWKNEYDLVDDCSEKAKNLKVKPYETWADCISGMTDDEVQMLSGKMVFEWAYKMLQDEKLKQKEIETITKSFRGVVDQQNQLVGFAVVDPSIDLKEFRREHFATISPKALNIPAVYISFIVTTPANLKKPPQNRIKGLGTALVALGVLESQRRGNPSGRLLLESMPSAVGFYKHLGFWNIGTRRSIKTDFYPLPILWLEADAGTKILHKAGLKVISSKTQSGH